ncbi:Cyc3p [Saccharomyces cerevisiae FostersB]|nr:Cyc3p [Saccharomyces cerevisiae FostersB]
MNFSNLGCTWLSSVCGFSHSSTSCQHPSFRKLWTCTMDSTASSATSPLPPILPFLTIALYICCGEGYSQNSLLSGLLGMLEMVRSTGKSIFLARLFGCCQLRHIVQRVYSIVISLHNGALRGWWRRRRRLVHDWAP